MKEPRYRPNVAAILRRGDGRLLLGERSDAAGCWQFPQGGQKPRETPREALERELQEELGLAPESYRVAEQRGPYEYLFGNGRTKDGFDGQRQSYFLLDLIADGVVFDFGTESPEFRATRWVYPTEFKLAWVPSFKRGAYRQVFQDFFGVLPG
ncbi:MAG TPA: NUDIX domain-containing protein [Chthoniobacterales bacterium]